MWNNRKEEYMFHKDQEKRFKEYRRFGVSEAQICIMEEPEQKAFVEKRKKARAGYEEVPLSVTDENGFEHEIDPMALSYEENFCSNPFEFGFDDPRLNKIWASADDIDKKILQLLGEGMTQTEIEALTGIPQQTISYRIERFRKKFL